MNSRKMFVFGFMKSVVFFTLACFIWGIGPRNVGDNGCGLKKPGDPVVSMESSQLHGNFFERCGGFLK